MAIFRLSRPPSDAGSAMMCCDYGIAYTGWRNTLLSNLCGA